MKLFKSMTCSHFERSDDVTRTAQEGYLRTGKGSGKGNKDDQSHRTATIRRMTEAILQPQSRDKVGSAMGMTGYRVNNHALTMGH